MDNWDFMEENLATAANSSGDLQEQADIYAESWEAAQKRVKTALQAIYSDLVDDNFFIGLSDNFAKLLEVIDKVIKSMGGVKGVLASVGGIFLSLYASKMPAAIDNLKANFWVFTGQAKKAMLQVQNKTEKYLKTVEQGNYSLTFKTQAEGLAKVDAMQQKLILNASNMTEQEQDAYKLVIQNVQAMYKEAEAASKVVEALQEKADIEKKQVVDNVTSGAKQTFSDYLKALDDQEKLQERLNSMTPGTSAYNKVTWDLEDVKTEAKQLKEQIDDIFSSLEIESVDVTTLTKEETRKLLNDIKTGAQGVTETVVELYQKFEQVESIRNEGSSNVDLWKNEAKAIQGDIVKLDALKKKMKEYLETVKSQNKILDKNGFLSKLQEEIDGLDDTNLNTFLDNFEDNFNFTNYTTELSNEIEDAQDLLQRIGGSDAVKAFNLALGAAAEKNQTLKNALDNTRKSAEEMPQSTLKASVAWTQFGSAVMGAYATLNSVKNLFSSFKDVIEGNGSALEVFSAIVSVAMTAISSFGEVQRLATMLSKSDTFVKGIQAAATKLLGKATQTSKVAKVAEAKATEEQAIANIALEATMSPILLITLAIVAAIALLVAAVIGITALVKAISVAIEDSTQSQERAKQSVEELTEKYSELKTEYEDLKTAIEDYQEAYKAFQELEKGAEGYADALDEANQAAKDLIETYGLYGKWFYDSNGAIQFDEGVLENLESEKQKEVAYANLQKDVAGSVLNRENEKAYYESVRKQNLNSAVALMADDTFEIIRDATDEEILAAKDRVNAKKNKTSVSKEKAENKEDKEITLPSQSDALLQMVKEGQARDAAATPNYFLNDGSEIEETTAAIDENLNNLEEVLEADTLESAIEKLGDEFDNVRNSALEFAQQADYYTQTIAKDYVQIQGKYADDSVAQNAYANLLAQQDDFKYAVDSIPENVSSITSNGDLYDRIREYEGKSEDDPSLYGDYLTDDELAKAYAKYVKGWSDEEIDGAVYDGKTGSGTLTSGEQTFTNNDQAMREEVAKAIFSKSLVEKGTTQYNEVDTAALDANMAKIDAVGGAVADTIYGALQNWQEGTELTIDSSLISPEEAAEMKEVVNSLSEEGGQTYVTALQSAIESYDPSKYWDKLEQQQSENIDQQVTDNELDADTIAIQTELIQENTEALKDNENAAKQLAVNNTRMNKGMETLIDNWEDWKEVLEDGDKTSTEYAETVADLRDTIGDLIGLSDDMSDNLSAAFFDSADNLALLERAANADEDAITELGVAASKDLVSNLSIAEDVIQSFEDNAESIQIGDETYNSLNALTTAFEDCKNNVLASIDTIADKELQLGDNLADVLSEDDFKQFVDGLNEMAAITGMSVEDMQSMLNSLGVEANVKSEWVDETVNVPVYHTERTNQQDLDGDGIADSWDEKTWQIDTAQMPGGRYVASISYDGSDPKSSVNYIGHGRASTSNKTKSSSSGGSSKSKSKQDTKKFSDEFDRYHDIKETIEEVEDAVSDLGRQQKHLSGNELADNLRKQNALLEQQAADYRILAAMQKEEQQELQATLSQYGMAFDQQTGLTTNYAQVTAAALAEMNAAIEAYNASAQEEADKTALEAAENKYDAFKKALERYDSLVDEIRDTENNLDDIYYTQVANTLDAWEAEIEIKLDLSEAKRTWEEFIDEISDDFTSVYKDISKNMSSLVEQAKTYMGADGTIATDLSNVQHAQDFIDQAQGMNYDSDAFRNLAVAYGYASISEAQDKLKEYNETLQDDASDLYSLYENTWDTYIEGIDQAVDKFDDLTEAYDNINDDLDHQAKLIELLYGEQAYDYLNQLYTAESENLLGKMNNLAQQINFYQQQYENAVSAYGADSEAAEKFKDAWTSALDDLNSTEEEYLESIQNKALNAIDKIFDDLDSRLTGGSSLSWVSEQWEDATNAAEGYYDDVERIYQLEALEQKFNKAVNDASSLKSQQALKTILDEQLASLENKTTLSEYDIELAEKRLAVYQAQIALEDAQNNKTSMKLIRNEAGNWTYQYTADENDVQSKQEALMQAQNEYYEFAKSSWEDLTNTIIEDTQTAMDRIKELEEESITATTERQAEIAEQIEYLREYYWGSEGVITKEIAEHAEYEDNLNQATAETLWGLYDIDVENFTLMTDTEKDLINQLKDYGVNNFQTLYDAVAQNYDDIQNKCDEINAESLNTWTTTAAEMCRIWASDDEDSVKTAVTSALAQCDQAVVDYATLVQIGCAAAQDNFANVGEQIYQDQLATYALEGQTEQLVQSTVDNLTVYAQYLAEIQSMWQGVADKIANATQAAIAYLAVQGIEASVKATTTSTTTTGSTGTAQTTTPSTTNNSSSGKNNSNNKKTEEEVKNEIGVHGGGDIFRPNGKLRGDRCVALMDTGGYTGEWSGDGGKLAVLHSKELVLNSSDTENILSAVNTIRSIAGVSNSITQAIAGGIAKMMCNVNGLNASSGGSNYSNKSNENNIFNITAEFPNAENVNEIREAIMSLPTLASQYLSKNLK